MLYNSNTKLDINNIQKQGIEKIIFYFSYNPQ